MKYLVLIFIVIAMSLLITQTADTSRPHFVVIETGEQLYVGSKIITTDKITLQLDDTNIYIDPRTNLTIKEISDRKLTVFASRGHWRILPDREITSCTRKVCATTRSPIDTRYYTPGEVVEINTSGITMIKHNDGGYILQEEDKIVIDELTDTVR